MMAELATYIKDIGYELADRICKRDGVERIEDEMVARLKRIPLLRLLISGCNRNITGGQNLIWKPSVGGRYTVVLNPVDGNVNYYRGSRLYGCSVSIVDETEMERYAVVYDGLNDNVLEFSSEKSEVDTIRSLEVHTRTVVGLGRITTGLVCKLEATGNLSWRWFGSTTLCILEVLRGHVDICAVPTKLWNFYWALGLSEQELLYIEDSQDNLISAVEKGLLTDPEKTFRLFCYKDHEVAEKFRTLCKGSVW